MCTTAKEVLDHLQLLGYFDDGRGEGNGRMMERLENELGAALAQAKQESGANGVQVLLHWLTHAVGPERSLAKNLSQTELERVKSRIKKGKSLLRGKELEEAAKSFQVAMNSASAQVERASSMKALRRCLADLQGEQDLLTAQLLEQKRALAHSKKCLSDRQDEKFGLAQRIDKLNSSRLEKHKRVLGDVGQGPFSFWQKAVPQLSKGQEEKANALYKFVLDCIEMKVEQSKEPHVSELPTANDTFAKLHRAKFALALSKIENVSLKAQHEFLERENVNPNSASDSDNSDKAVLKQVLVDLQRQYSELDKAQTYYGGTVKGDEAACHGKMLDAALRHSKLKQSLLLDLNGEFTDEEVVLRSISECLQTLRSDLKTVASSNPISSSVSDTAVQHCVDLASAQKYDSKRVCAAPPSAVETLESMQKDTKGMLECLSSANRHLDKCAVETRELCSICNDISGRLFTTTTRKATLEGAALGQADERLRFVRFYLNEEGL